MGIKKSKPIQEEDTGMMDESMREENGTLFRMFNRSQLYKLAKISIPGDSTYFYGTRMICMKSINEFIVIYASSYMVFTPKKRPRPTFLDCKKILKINFQKIFSKKIILSR